MPPRGAIFHFAQPAVDLAELRVDGARHLGGRRRRELDAEGGEDLHEHRTARVVALDLPAADGPAVSAYRRRELGLGQAGLLAEEPQPCAEFTVRSRRGPGHARSLGSPDRFVSYSRV